jgi:L-aminopeptidase/D-esterase-like protein
VTLIEGADVRTGVTAILPSEADVAEHQLFAGCHTLNRNGIARTGGAGEHSSGDIMIAFSTARQGLPPSDADDDQPVTVPITMFVDSHISPLYHAAIEATEAAIVNALLAAETMTGRGGVTAYGLEPDQLLEAMRRCNFVSDRGGRRLVLADEAAVEPEEDQHADDRPDETAEVEHVVVADAE